MSRGGTARPMRCLSRHRRPRHLFRRRLFRAPNYRRLPRRRIRRPPNLSRSRKLPRRNTPLRLRSRREWFRRGSGSKRRNTVGSGCLTDRRRPAWACSRTLISTPRLEGGLGLHPRGDSVPTTTDRGDGGLGGATATRRTLGTRARTACRTRTGAERITPARTSAAVLILAAAGTLAAALTSAAAATLAADIIGDRPSRRRPFSESTVFPLKRPKPRSGYAPRNAVCAHRLLSFIFCDGLTGLPDAIAHRVPPDHRADVHCAHDSLDAAPRLVPRREPGRQRRFPRREFRAARSSPPTRVAGTRRPPRRGRGRRGGATRSRVDATRGSASRESALPRDGSMPVLGSQYERLLRVARTTTDSKHEDPMRRIWSTGTSMWTLPGP
jgi:hypothetical protein